MIKIILLLTLSVNAFGQITTTIEKGEGNSYKGYFYEPYKHEGNLKETLCVLWDIDSKRIFSNKMNVMEDSTSINLELQYRLRYSRYVEDLLIESLQTAYLFITRDTLLDEMETVYAIKVIDPTRLQKHKVTDHKFISGPNAFMVYNGFHLNDLQHILYGMNLETKEQRIDKIKIPVVMDLLPKYDGLYNYAIKVSTYDENGAEAYYDSLFDMNPVLFQYGLQVQKVTRPVMGKVVEFIEIPDRVLPFKFELKY